MRFGIISDVHNGTSPCQYVGNAAVETEPDDRLWWDIDVNKGYDNRWYSTAPDRLKAFGTSMQADGRLDFCLDLGDLIDSQWTTQTNGELAEAVASIEAGVSADGYDGEMFYVLGNHEMLFYSDSLSGANGQHDSWNDYYASIPDFTSDMRGHPHSAWTSSDGDAVTSYSFDRGGIHFTVLGSTGHFESTGLSGTDSWLDDDLAATNLPIVIFTHPCTYVTHLGAGLATIFPGVDFDNIYANFNATIAANNVQAMLSGHTHIGIAGGYPFRKVVENVPRFTLHGNLITPTLTASIGVENAAYYIFDIVPNAYKDRNNKWQANISVEGFSQSGTSVAKKAFIL